MQPLKITDDNIVKAAELHIKKHFLDYIPHKKQLRFHGAGAKAKERLFLAGNRTGKTFGGITECAMHLTGNYPDWWNGKRFNRPIKAWAASVTNALTAEVLEQGYLDVIAEDLIIGKDRLKHTYKIKHSTGGISELTFKSYEQGRKKFQAAKLDLVHLDEEPPRDIYVESLMRTMSTDADNRGILVLTMTPLLGVTELVLQFTDSKAEGQVIDDKFYIMASWADNPHLLDHEKELILKSLNPIEREAREKGIPSMGSGLVYPVFEDAVTVQPFAIPSHWAKVYALDFGWTNPTAALFAAIDRDNDLMYLTAEYYVAERTPQQHTYELIQMGADKIPGVYDPAGEQSSQKDGEAIATLYRQSGLHNLSKAINAKEKGVMDTLTRFQNGKLKIFTTLTQTLREFRMYNRDEKGIIKKGNDHLMDCMRYLVVSGMGVAQSVEMQQRYHIRSHSGQNSNSWMAG